jgi:hypothetical protein
MAILGKGHEDIEDKKKKRGLDQGKHALFYNIFIILKVLDEKELYVN